MAARVFHPTKDADSANWWTSLGFGSHYDRPQTAYDWHLGVDLNWGSGSDDRGQQVYAVADGTIVDVRHVSGYGGAAGQANMAIQHVTMADGHKFTLLYGHVAPGVGTGAITAGTQLGTIIDYATGPHLHFAVARGHTYDIVNGYTNAAFQPRPGSDGLDQHTVTTTGGERTVYVDPADWMAKYVNATVAAPPKASVLDAAVTEGGTLAFTVTLDRAATETIKVHYSTVAGTAGERDFVPETGFVTVLKGQTTAREQITIETRNDRDAEGTEVMAVSLTRATGGVGIADGTGIGTIRDDDGRADLSIAKFRVEDATLARNQKLVAIVDVKNGGTADADGITSFYWSRNKTFEAGTDKLLDTVVHGLLTAGELDTNERETISYSTLKKHGDGYVIAVIDAANLLAEGSAGERNNVSSAIWVDIL
jgi:hypothetical protein